MSYSQSKALWAITKASFKAIFSQPSALFFSLLFPIVFILIFGAFSDRPASPYKIAIDCGSDTTTILYDSIVSNKAFDIITYADTTLRNADLEKGNIAAIVSIKKRETDSTTSNIIHLLSSDAEGGAIYNLMKALDYQALQIELKDAHQVKREYSFKTDIIPGKKYRQIDFVLPGQLGFSILFATMFGISFVFFNLREQLVLKRFYASPVKKINILIGIGASRLFFQLINIVVLILVGHFFMHFTLVNGALTFLEMILLTIYMLFLLMGVGLIFSSLAKSDTSIPLLINLFGFPQMLLSGTFFPIDVFPQWLQNLCQALPLTQFNNAMRKISFEGLHLYDCWKELGILALWIIAIYAIVIKVMKWE